MTRRIVSHVDRDVLDDVGLIDHDRAVGLRAAAAREVMTAEVQAALEAVLRTVPLSDETRERIAELWSEGGDADGG
jgi:hypothetical protein